MCFKHAAFRAVLTSSTFDDICAVVIDEAHCISQWGGDFRTAYSELGKLCAFSPPHIPFLLVSATLNPSALQDVRGQLAIDPTACFFLYLGNDCHNIAYSVLPLNSTTDYDALEPLLLRAPTPSLPKDLFKSIVFVNAVNTAQLAKRAIFNWLPAHLHGHVGFLHAHRTSRARRRVMRLFRKGRVRILVATEAAGMVCPVLLYVQFPGLTVLLRVRIYRTLSL